MVRPEARRERSLGLFALGLLIFSPALLSIFTLDSFVLGVPLPFLYLFAAWTALIVMMALNAGALRPSGPAPGPAPGPPPGLPPGRLGDAGGQARRGA